MKVLKRNGKKEDFDREKIVTAITKAGGKSGIAMAVAKDVENTLAKKATVTTDQIRVEVFNRLKIIDMETYARWVQYDRKTKGRA